MTNNTPQNGKRGFALLAQEKQREIAQAGGRAAHRAGAAHEFTIDEARQAGRKGGLAVSVNREHMARIGRNGGKARRGSRNMNKKNDGPALAAVDAIEGVTTQTTKGRRHEGEALAAVAAIEAVTVP